MLQVTVSIFLWLVMLVFVGVVIAVALAGWKYHKIVSSFFKMVFDAIKEAIDDIRSDQQEDKDIKYEIEASLTKSAERGKEIIKKWSNPNPDGDSSGGQWVEEPKLSAEEIKKTISLFSNLLTEWDDFANEIECKPGDQYRKMEDLRKRTTDLVSQCNDLTTIK